MKSPKFQIGDKVLIKSKSYGRGYDKLLNQGLYEIDASTGYLIGYIIGLSLSSSYYILSHDKKKGGGDYFLEKDLLEHFYSDIEFIKDEDLFI